MTIARMIRLNKVPARPCLALREMEAKDIPQVAELYSRYMDRFDMATDMTKEEIEHIFLSGRGGEPSDTKGRRTGQIVWSYVVEVSGLLFFCLQPL
jgi:glycylpeptide N-tetradecanoyltransferase